MFERKIDFMIYLESFFKKLFECIIQELQNIVAKAQSEM